MFKIDPDTLYTLKEVEDRLKGIVELGTLLDRTGLRNGRVFRAAVLGSEILEAVRAAPKFSDGDGSFSKSPVKKRKTPRKKNKK